MKDSYQLWEIVIEIYEALYKAASPSADFKELWCSGVGTERDFFMAFYLDGEKAREIMEKIMKKHKCSPFDRHLISVEVNLGCAPRAAKGTRGQQVRWYIKGLWFKLLSWRAR